MVWLLQRNNEILTCEIREGVRPRQYRVRGRVETWSGRDAALRLADGSDQLYLRWQTALRAQGWRPRIVEEELG